MILSTKLPRFFHRYFPLRKIFFKSSSAGVFYQVFLNSIDEADRLMTDQIQLENQSEQKKLLNFLCIALGGNSFLHPHIDANYHENNWAYYEAYQRSGLKGNLLFSMYTTKSEEKIRQVAGIVEWCNENQQFYLIYQLIKKGYKFVYQYFQQNTQIDFEHFMRAFAKRQKNKMVKEIELVYQNIVLWYLCKHEKKPFNKNSVAWLSFQEVLSFAINESTLQESLFSTQLIEEHMREIENLYDEYNIPKNPRFDSIGSLLQYLISDHIKRIYKTDPTVSAEYAEKHVFQVSPSKYIGAIGGWVKTLFIHELDATEQIPLTKKDLDMVFLELLYAIEYNSITKEEQALFFISSLYLKCLSSLYRETKELYLDQSKQDYYLEMKTKEAQIKEQEVILLLRKQEWELANSKLQREIEGVTEELRGAQAKIRQLEQQIENMEDYTVEVHSLRQYAYREERKEIDEKVPSLKMMEEFIQTKRIIIFGGSSTWQQKLKKVLPTVEFLDVKEKNRDISKIQRTDAIFINTSVFAHSFYKKIMKEVNKCRAPLFYLSGHSNTEKAILEIYKWLT